MNALDQLKQHNRHLLVEDFQERRTRLLAKPITLQIEPSNRCPLHCIQCAHQYWGATENRSGELPSASFSLLVPLLPTLDRLVIGGLGEPLVSPLTPKLVALGREYSCEVELITSAAVLGEQQFAQLAACPPSHLTVSIDAARADSYARLRGVPLRQTLINLRRLAALPCRKRLNAVIFSENAPELEALVDLAAAHGFEAVNAINPRLYGQKLVPASPFLHRELVERSLEKAAALAKRCGLQFTAFSLDESSPPICRQPFEMLFVRHTLEVFACCSAIFSNPGYSFRLGKLEVDPPRGRGAPLLDFWNCQQIQAYREAFFGLREFPRQCQSCAFRNNTLDAHLRTNLQR